MYNVSRYPAKATISATNHSVPEIHFRKIMSGYSGTFEKNKTRFHEKYCDSLFLFRCAFPIYFPIFFLKSYHKIRQVFLKDSKFKRKTLAERGFDPRTSGLWAQHASTAPLCFTYYPQNAIYGSRRIMSVPEKYKNKKSNQKYCTSKYLIISSNQNNTSSFILLFTTF